MRLVTPRRTLCYRTSRWTWSISRCRRHPRCPPALTRTRYKYLPTTSTPTNTQVSSSTSHTGTRWCMDGHQVVTWPSANGVGRINQVTVYLIRPASTEMGDPSCCVTTQSGQLSLLSSARWAPLPSNRHHRSCGDCLEGKGENYQVRSVQYCVQQLCTVQCTHI